MKQNQASSTARLIAVSTVFLSRDPRLGGLVPPRAEEACVWFMETFSSRAGLLLALMDKKWFRRLAFAFEQATLPGILLHYILRKRFIEAAARQAIQNGVGQIVVLGAGFDTLALRLSREFPAVRFIEIDHPATQRVKRTALDRRPTDRDNLTFISADFTRQMIDHVLLENYGYRPGADTYFVAEGVLMYLNVSDVLAVFQFIRTHSGPKSIFAFTFMEPAENGRIEFRNSRWAVEFWLNLRHEPFVWGIRRAALPEFLAGAGFVQQAMATPEIYRSRYLHPAGLDGEPLAEGEYVCIAELGDKRTGKLI